MLPVSAGNIIGDRFFETGTEQVSGTARSGHFI